MKLEIKNILRMTIAGLCTLLLVGIGLIALERFGQSAWQAVAEPMGWDTEEPPFALTLLVLFALPFLPRLPFVLRRDMNLQASCIVNAPLETVMEALDIHPGDTHYHPQVHRIENVDSEPGKLRFIMKHLDKPDHSKKMTSIFTQSVSESGEWVRYDYERSNGLPAWDRKLKWMSFHLEELGDGKTRLGINKHIRNPRVWGWPLYKILNPALHDLSGVKALSEGKTPPSTMFTLWLDMFKPEPTYEGWSTEEWEGIGLHNPWQRWALIIALVLPIAVLILVTTLIGFSK